MSNLCLIYCYSQCRRKSQALSIPSRVCLGWMSMVRLFSVCFVYILCTMWSCLLKYSWLYCEHDSDKSYIYTTYICNTTTIFPTLHQLTLGINSTLNIHTYRSIFVDAPILFPFTGKATHDYFLKIVPSSLSMLNGKVFYPYQYTYAYRVSVAE